jgi:hypothetical protein
MSDLPSPGGILRRITRGTTEPMMDDEIVTAIEREE